MFAALRIAALYVGYGAIGFAGDEAIGLMARELATVRGAGDVAAVVSDAVVAAPARVRAASRERCAYEAERRVELDASSEDLLRLVAGAGDLTVEGREGVDRVRAVGRACASEEAYLEELRLTLERRGGAIELTAHYPERAGRRGWRGEDYARIDLAVEVPLGMEADVTDSSGGMEISGTGALSIDDSSGEIVVRDAAGSVTIEDSSGGIAVRGTTGSVTIEDSSGEVDLRDVGGDVEVRDGSGEIFIADVRGGVRIRDGSGSIDAVRIGRSVTIEADGSGSIDVRDVEGDFTVRSDGSGSIGHSGVAGTVDVPRKGRRRGG